MDKEKRIKVWEDTVKLVTEDKKTKFLSHYITFSSPTIQLMESYIANKPIISVVNEDCMVTAERFSKLGKVAILNMASYKLPGGGVRKGSMAQEEELARRSNLVWGMPTEEEAYPLKLNDVIYSPDIRFFKDGNYNLIPGFNADVISIASVNLNGLPRPKNYLSIMAGKMKAMFDEPRKNNCEYLVLSAFGCGVFKNNPSEVAGLFKQIIAEGYANYYKEVAFAILNDKNSVGNNYEIFKTTLTN